MMAYDKVMVGAETKVYVLSLQTQHYDAGPCPVLSG